MNKSPRTNQILCSSAKSEFLHFLFCVNFKLILFDLELTRFCATQADFRIYWNALKFSISVRREN